MTDKSAREIAFEVLQDTQGHDAGRKVDIIAKALLSVQAAQK